MDLAAQLRPGDVLLYRGTGLYGFLIRVHTWHDVGHVEVYVGEGQSEASRDGLGVGRYPLRTADLLHVLRPKPPLDLAAGERWFATVKGTPYGWLDLLQFVGVPIDAPGIVCSPFATERCRAVGFDPFNGEAAAKIAPFEFLLSDQFRRVEIGDAPVGAGTGRAPTRSESVGAPR